MVYELHAFGTITSLHVVCTKYNVCMQALHCTNQVEMWDEEKLELESIKYF